MDLEKLRQRHRRIQPPLDYYSGTTDAPVPSVPRRVLVFNRDQFGQIVIHRASTFRFVLAINLGGEGRLLIDERLFYFREQSAILVFPFQVHQYVDIGVRDISWLYITFELDVSDDVLALRDAPVALTAASLAELDRMTQTYLAIETTDAELAPDLELRLLLLLNELCRVAKTSSVEEHRVQHATHAHQLIQRTVTHVHHNIGSRLTGESIAEAVNISESHLRRLFKEHLGMSLRDYVDETRINRSSSLLVDTTLTVGQISEQIGFESQFSFSRFFRRHVGMAPRDYRTSMRERVHIPASSNNGG